MRDGGVRRILFETESWGLYTPDGTFLPERPQDLLAGRPRMLDQPPPQRDLNADYDWLIQHPRDRGFPIIHQCGWHWMYLAIAQFHQPDEKWVREFENEILMHIAVCPELPSGQKDFGRGRDRGGEGVHNLGGGRTWAQDRAGSQPGEARDIIARGWG